MPLNPLEPLSDCPVELPWRGASETRMYLSSRRADCGLLGRDSGPVVDGRGRLHPIPVQKQTWLIESAYCILHQLHFHKRKQERERRLGTLVQVEAIYVQRIMATAGVCRINLQTEIVPTEKPIE